MSANAASRRTEALEHIAAAQLRTGLHALCLAFALGGGAQAQTDGSWARWDTAAGDWGGLRTRLNDDGVNVSLQWWTNIASNPSGGASQGSTYTDSWNLALDFDMQKLVAWPGGSIHVVFTQRAGTSLSAQDIGNIFAVQQVFGPVETWRLTELSVEQSFDGGTWNLRGGRYPNNDFATSPLYCLFMNQGLCGYPGGIAQDLSLPYFPVSAWGARLRWQPTQDVRAMVGVFEVNPSLNDSHGFDWSTSGGTGTAVVGEVWYQREGSGTGLPGHYKLGAWSQSGDAPADGGDDSKSGLYLLADQTLLAGRPGTGAAGTPSGLTLFGGVSWNHGKASKVEHAAFAGLVANGLWAARPFDTQGIAVTGARFDGVGQSWETVIELHYGIQVAKWFSLQPNLQWVLRPGATGQIPSAFVVGLQTVMDF